MLSDESGSRQKEMLALEAQLRSSVRLQLENARDSIRHLGEARDQLRESGEALDRVTGLCKQSETLIDNYPFIKQVSRTHQNFNLTRRVYEEFCALDAKVERCALLLERDQESGEPHNLLLVYHYLFRLDNFRKQTLGLMSDAPSTALYTIKRYFKKLDDLSNAFEEFFWRLPRQIFQYAEEGKASFIVYMVKVLWVMDVEQRSRFFAILDDMIANKFTIAVRVSGFAPNENPSGVLDAIDFWLTDLELVSSNLISKFPAEFSILDFFVLNYHRNIHAILNHCLMAKLEPADILYILGWVQAYHDDMTTKFGISSDDLEPRLLDDREPQLIALHVALSRANISQWIGNLFNAEAKAFTERATEPDIDAEDHYTTPGGIDLFQICKQHIDTAAQASKGRLLMEIVNECAKGVNDYIFRMSRLLDQERKYEGKNPPANLEAYIIMLGNTSLKWVSYVQDLVGDVEELIAAECKATASKALKSIADNFVSLAKSCTQALADIIFVTVKDAVQKLFTAEWYGDAAGPPTMETIVFTFNDYLNDYTQHADQFLINKLVSDMFETFTQMYLEQLRARSTKLLMGRAPSLFVADLTALQECFALHRDPERVKRAIDPLARCIALICSSERMLFLEFAAFYKMYPDLKLSFFEEVLLKRDDMEKAAVKELVENCRKKTKEEKFVDTPPSVFSKLK